MSKTKLDAKSETETINSTLDGSIQDKTNDVDGNMDNKSKTENNNNKDSNNRNNNNRNNNNRNNNNKNNNNKNNRNFNNKNNKYNKGDRIKKETSNKNIDNNETNNEINNKELSNNENPDEDSKEETEDCLICANPIKIVAIMPCNHKCCHICALRMRVLYKSKNCAHCRSEAKKIIFSTNTEKNFEDFTIDDIVQHDKKISADFDSLKCYEDTINILHITCPDKNCSYKANSYKELYKHTETVHNKELCYLCVNQYLKFSFEHVLFTPSQLVKHINGKDSKSQKKDGFNGHPRCVHCGIHFYDNDSLHLHCREKHERCFICDKLYPSSEPSYFKNFDSLSRHFNDEHYPCNEKECKEAKFVVFPTLADLKLHQLEVHPNKFRGNEAKGLGLQDFLSYSNPRKSKKSQDDLNTITSNDSRRYAPQSQEEIDLKNKSNEKRPNFGSQLSFDPSSSLVGSSSQFSSSIRSTPVIHMSQSSRSNGSRKPVINKSSSAESSSLSLNNFSFSANSTINHSKSSTSITDKPISISSHLNQSPIIKFSQTKSNPMTSFKKSFTALEERFNLEKALNPGLSDAELKHKILNDQAYEMLHGNPNKHNAFRDINTLFKNNGISAKELVSSYISLFSTDPSGKIVNNGADTGRLVRQFADLFTREESKAMALRSAWNDWKIKTGNSNSGDSINKVNTIRMKPQPGLSSTGANWASKSSNKVASLSPGKVPNKSKLDTKVSNLTIQEELFPSLPPVSKKGVPSITNKSNKVAKAATVKSAWSTNSSSASISSPHLQQQSSSSASITKNDKTLRGRRAKERVLFQSGF